MIPSHEKLEFGSYLLTETSHLILDRLLHAATHSHQCATLAANFDGLWPLLVACHCQPFCSLANKLRSFVGKL